MTGRIGPILQILVLLHILYIDSWWESKRTWPQWKAVWRRFLKVLNLEPLDDLAAQHLNVYPRELKSGS